MRSRDRDMHHETSVASTSAPVDDSSCRLVCSSMEVDLEGRIRTPGVEQVLPREQRKLQAASRVLEREQAILNLAE